GQLLTGGGRQVCPEDLYGRQFRQVEVNRVGVRGDRGPVSARHGERARPGVGDRETAVDAGAADGDAPPWDGTSVRGAGRGVVGVQGWASTLPYCCKRGGVFKSVPTRVMAASFDLSK